MGLFQSKSGFPASLENLKSLDTLGSLSAVGDGLGVEESFLFRENLALLSWVFAFADTQLFQAWVFSAWPLGPLSLQSQLYALHRESVLLQPSVPRGGEAFFLSSAPPC